MLRRWNFVVFSVMPSCAAISLLRSPAVTRRSTSTLALGESIRVAGGVSGGQPSSAAPGQLGDDARGRRRRDRRLAPTDGVDHRPELRALQVLEEVAAGAGLDRREQVVLVLADGQHHDRRPRARSSTIRRVASRPATRASDVHEDEVGPQRDRRARPPPRRPRPARRPRGPTRRAARRPRRGTSAWSSASTTRITAPDRTSAGSPLDPGQPEPRAHRVDRHGGTSARARDRTTVPPSPVDHATVAPIAVARSRIASSP